MKQEIISKTVEKPHVRRTSWTIVAISACFASLHHLPNPQFQKKPHVLQTLKLNMQFFSRCCHCFGSWWLPLSTVRTYCKSFYLQGCMSLKWHKIYYLHALFIIKKIKSQNYKLTRTKKCIPSRVEYIYCFFKTHGSLYNSITSIVLSTS